MQLRSAITAFFLILSSLGSMQGSLVQSLCSDSGKSGLAMSVELACEAVRCDVCEDAGETCAEETCCQFEQLPARPLAPLSPDSSSSKAPLLAGALLSALPAPLANPAPAWGANSIGARPAPDRGPFPGYSLPLLI